MSIGIERRAHCRDLLVAAFARVPVGFKILKGPIDSSNRTIFQMDINQSRRFGEYIRIWPGGRDNQIEVIDIDRNIRQLILRVKEARRSYTQTVRKTPMTSLADVEERIRSEGGRILSEDRMAWTLQLWTPSEERRFLCGMDDLHLFVAQVPEASTVKEAHELLKPRLVTEAETRRPLSVKRQGEWFFLSLTAAEREDLARNAMNRPRAVKQQRPIGPGGRPHIADQVMQIERRIRVKRREHRKMEVFACGTVRHPDHRPLYLREWNRVIRNREVRNDRLRLRWID